MLACVVYSVWCLSAGRHGRRLGCPPSVHPRLRSVVDEHDHRGIHQLVQHHQSWQARNADRLQLHVPVLVTTNSNTHRHPYKLHYNLTVNSNNTYCSKCFRLYSAMFLLLAACNVIAIYLSQLYEPTCIIYLTISTYYTVYMIYLPMYFF